MLEGATCLASDVEKRRSPAHLQREAPGGGAGLSGLTARVVVGGGGQGPLSEPGHWAAHGHIPARTPLLSPDVPAQASRHLPPWRGGRRQRRQAFRDGAGGRPGSHRFDDGEPAQLPRGRSPLTVPDLNRASARVCACGRETRGVQGRAPGAARGVGGSAPSPGAERSAHLLLGGQSGKSASHESRGARQGGGGREGASHGVTRQGSAACTVWQARRGGTVCGRRSSGEQGVSS